MTVTEIRPVTKQKYQIEVEGHSPFVLYKGEVFRYHIEKDREISPEIYREIIEEVLTKRAKLRALHLLEQGDRTKKDLEEKLLKNGYPPEAAEAALAYVESFHYIDDKRYALSYIQNQSGRKGRARIQMELRRKGVPQEYIDQAFQEMEEETDTEAVIRELVQKKRRGQGPMDEKEKQRLYGFLLRRGFSTSDILCVLREFSEDDEGNLT
ncbi:MAG TPA: recombination regulator RecX [Candidatus Blautia ornithocaccae]|uniref:regulatory protein RecX n=1 Tax=Blautia sp. An81 TaxID=1965659 RepID=UPI000B396284|nr:regulatory protein RecX [Blautia sp. An81]OUN31857.1 RecX family transcriptional regulator [Blautia sp. An81]HJD37579.1 recombination regulator RecX [Candidatus Blautia ornithocaccae]